MTDFEPLERYLLGRSPQASGRWKSSSMRCAARFGGPQGGEALARVEAVVRGCDLVGRLERGRWAHSDRRSSRRSSRSCAKGSRSSWSWRCCLPWWPRPQSSRTGADSRSRRRDAGDLVGRRAGRVASIATAVVLNVLVDLGSGPGREILEGLVMLVASGILFYVSYWLISQVEAKRWMDFLKKQARHGLDWAGGTLAVTAFLAVYREGAETSLMYQALLGSEGTTQAGLLGLTVGLALGWSSWP